jgi:leucine dehydrogenase
MMLFDHPEFDDHEHVVFARDVGAGLRAIIAVHSTRAGPACGGVRFWHYPGEAAALADALRLSRAMSYKNVMAGLPLGGGKSVIMADAARTKTPELLHAFGRALHRLGGTYVAAEDVGITTDDIARIREATPHVAGTPAGESASGDPSPFTARGVLLGMEAAARFRFGARSLDGLTIGVQGLGAVGMKLAELLSAAGARLVVADLDPRRVETARARLRAESCPPDALPAQPMEIFAPCALGGVLTPAVIAAMEAKVVAGSANNQLASAAAGRLLQRRGILYAPDYVINAGGVINVASEVGGRYDPAAVEAAIANIPRTLELVFARAAETDRPTSEVADEMARARLAALAPRPRIRPAA